MPKGLPFELKSYLELVELTGRCMRADKRGYIEQRSLPILERLKIAPENWLKLTTQFTKVLFFEFKSSDTKIFKGTESAVLNEEVYSQVRDKIVTKLGGKIAQNVDEIEI